MADPTTPTPAPRALLPDEDDFTHYFNATARLSEENARLAAQVETLTRERDEARRDLGFATSTLRTEQRICDEERQLRKAAEAESSRLAAEVERLTKERNIARRLLDGKDGWVEVKEDDLERLLTLANGAGAEVERVTREKDDAYREGRANMHPLMPTLQHKGARRDVEAAILSALASAESSSAAQVETLTKERDEATEDAKHLRREVTLLTHKVITCGVAASHPDPDLSRCAKNYGGPWDSPQAEKVRELRAERDRLAAEVERLRMRLESQTARLHSVEVARDNHFSAWQKRNEDANSAFDREVAALRRLEDARRERDEARAEVERVTREREEARATADRRRETLEDYDRRISEAVLRATRAESEVARLTREAGERERALTEVVRRASLPVSPTVNGLPASKEECAAAVERCARLVVDHVVEPARAALSLPSLTQQRTQEKQQQQQTSYASAPSVTSRGVASDAGCDDEGSR